MLLLTPPPQPRWETITLAPDVTLAVEVTPPSFDVLIGERAARTIQETITVRLSCITNWRDVVAETPDGGRLPVPFDRDRLTHLLNTYRQTMDLLLAIVRPFFDGPNEAHEKNSEPPPSAATQTIPPSLAMPPSADSQPSVTTSASP